LIKKIKKICAWFLILTITLIHLQNIRTKTFMHCVSLINHNNYKRETERIEGHSTMHSWHIQMD
jgi:hypothetical protein